MVYLYTITFSLFAIYRIVVRNGCRLRIIKILENITADDAKICRYAIIFLWTIKYILNIIINLNYFIYTIKCKDNIILTKSFN